MEVFVAEQKKEMRQKLVVENGCKSLHMAWLVVITIAITVKNVIAIKLTLITVNYDLHF